MAGCLRLPSDASRESARVRRILAERRILTQLQLSRDGIRYTISHKEGTSMRIKDVIPAGTPELNKVIFGLAQQPDILQVVQGLGRKTAVLVGLETDVCVQHSAFGLMQLGYTVVAVVDATASPESGHDLGLARMRDAGVVMVSAKGLFYEWSRDIAKIGEILQSNRIDRPKGLLL
jgi:hypothetical protein